jgi:hypothetical protein
MFKHVQTFSQDPHESVDHSKITVKDGEMAGLAIFLRRVD